MGGGEAGRRPRARPWARQRVGPPSELVPRLRLLPASAATRVSPSPSETGAARVWTVEWAVPSLG